MDSAQIQIICGTFTFFTSFSERIAMKHELCTRGSFRGSGIEPYIVAVVPKRMCSPRVDTCNLKRRTGFGRIT